MVPFSVKKNRLRRKSASMYMAHCQPSAINSHLLLASALPYQYNGNCSDYTLMTAEKKMVKSTVRIPEHLIKQLKEAGEKHYRCRSWGKYHWGYTASEPVNYYSC